MVANGKQHGIICINSSMDQEFQKELFTHLVPLNIAPFSPDQITAGSNRKAEIEKRICQARIILLLISSDFLSEHIDEMQKSLHQHHTGQARVLPILLRPSSWDKTELNGFRVLPDDENPVEKWANRDDAYINITNGIKKVIDDLTKEESSEVEEENKASFNVQSIIPLFDYLTTKHHIGIHRTIMHLVAQQSQKLGTQTTEQEIFREISKQLTIKYSPAEIRSSLAFLEERENLTKVRNFVDADAVFAETQQLPTDFVYAINARALQIEMLVTSWRSGKNLRGSLDQYNLLQIKGNLEQIHEWLTTAFDVVDDQLAQTIAEIWNRLFQDWQKLAIEVPLYLASLEKEAEKDLSSLENYLQHKHHIVNYINRFVNTLKEASPHICDIFAVWKSTGEHRDRLVLSIIKHDQQHNGYDNNTQQTTHSLTHDTYQQIDKIESWFLEQPPKFYYHANVAIQRLIAWADRISRHKQQQKNTDYLHELARLCLELKDVDLAQQVFSIVFAQALPLHVPSSTLTSSGIVDKTEIELVWLMPAPYRPTIVINTPISSDTSKPQQRKIDGEQARRELRDKNIRRANEREHTLQFLLSLMPLDLGTYTNVVDMAFCRILEEVIDTCQFDKKHQYDGPKGSIIVLRNPNEQAYTHICTCKGFFYIPCYRFDLLEPKSL